MLYSAYEKACFSLSGYTVSTVTWTATRSVLWHIERIHYVLCVCVCMHVCVCECVCVCLLFHTHKVAVEALVEVEGAGFVGRKRSGNGIAILRAEVCWMRDPHAHKHDDHPVIML